MKVSYKGNLILAVIWLLVSLLWFLWIQNAAVGIVWLLGGSVELALRLSCAIKKSISEWKCRRTGNGKLLVDCRYSDYLLVD